MELGDDAPWGGVTALRAFEAEHAEWLESYSAFMALKHRFGGHAWRLWPEQWRDWKPGIEATLPNSAAAEARRQRFYQFLFFRQWSALRDYANERGISLIGDVPIFVALDSADTWRWREVFRMDETGVPEAIAGVPPDYFSDRGQCWGNPLYQWDHLRATGYAWWIARLGAAFRLCDVVRLDHFRGFNDYWEIPPDAVDARRGQWLPGPGLTFFRAIQNALPEARLIAEDLGYVNAGVVQLRRSAGLPGMKILQFGYGHDDNNVNLPHFFDRDTVVYTGTHDNDTTRGWLEGMDAEQREVVQAYFNLPAGDDSAWPLIQAAYASVSRLAVISLQDLLDLPGTARMNRPGTVTGNWQWRFTAAMLDELRESKGERLRHWRVLYDRTGDARQRDYSAPPGELSSEESSAMPKVIPVS
jgi:4-alpha-glucanotransferase